MTSQTSDAESPNPIGSVEFKRVGKIGYITFSNPKKKNAITMQMSKTMLKSLRLADGDEKVKVIVIRSEGSDVFCAGWDLSMFKKLDQTVIDDLLGIGGHISRSIFFMKKPVVMEINGPAVGMGTIMSLSADFRICAGNSNVFFQLPELDLNPGIFPATGPTVGAVSLLGIARAKEMLLTSRRVPLEEFDRWGGVTQIVNDREELRSSTKKFARTIARKSSILLDLTKSAINIMGLNTAKECWNLEDEMAAYYFGGLMGKEIPSEDQFITDQWKKYGSGKEF